MGSKSRGFLQAEPSEYERRREYERAWLARASRHRREQCRPYIEATDRRWERRNGGMYLDAVAWFEAREAEAEFRRRVERETLLSALESEAADRAACDRLRGLKRL